MGAQRDSPKSRKIIKNRKKRVSWTHLKSIPQKTSEKLVLGKPWDLPNRAETLARTPFSRFQGVAEESSKMSQKAMLLGTSGHKKNRKHVRKGLWHQVLIAENDYPLSRDTIDLLLDWRILIFLTIYYNKFFWINIIYNISIGYTNFNTTIL